MAAFTEELEEESKSKESLKVEVKVEKPTKNKGNADYSINP